MKISTPLMLLLFIAFLSSPLHTQDLQQKADVSYTGNAIRVACTPVVAPFKTVSIEGKDFLNIGGYFDGTDPGTRAIPSEVLTIAIPAGSNPRLVLRNAEYTHASNMAPMPNPSAQVVGDTAIEYTYSSQVTSPAHVLPAAEITGFGWVRDYYCVYVRVNTYRFNEASSELSVLANVEFDLEFRGGLQQPMTKQAAAVSDPIVDNLVLNSSSAGAWKARPPVPESVAAAGDWIDYSQTYIKIRVGKDGVYRITGSDLQQWGADIGGIQPATLKLYESGEEVPIHVQSGAGFGTGDYVEFYGTRNYTEGDLYRTQTARDTDYVNYLNRYSDSTTYWLTWGGGNGLRVQDYALAAPADTVQTYRHLERIEANYYVLVGNASSVASQYPDWHDKHWAMFELKPGSAPRTIDFQMPVADYAPGTEARLLMKFQSAGYSPGFSPTHNVAAYVNDSPEPVDSVALDALEIGLVDGTVPADVLTNGTSKITIQTRPTQAPFNNISGDWLELEYNRYLMATEDRLGFRLDGNITSAGDKTVLMKGFSGDQIVVYKTAPELRRYTDVRTAANGGMYNAWFGDALTGNDRFFASTVDSVMTPAFVTLRAPGENAFPNLRAASNSGEYLIVTHPSLLTSAQQYAAFIASEYQVSTRVLDVMDISDEFTYGYFQPEAVRDFLQYAYTNWQQPAPEYVLFLGDAGYDYKNIRVTLDPNLTLITKGRNQNLVPTIGYPVGDAMMVMWDESNPLAIPQMAHGRIPAISNEDVLQFLERHREYRSAENTEWNKRYIVFTGGKDDNPSEIQQLINTNNSIIQGAITPAPVGGGYDHFYKTLNPKTLYGPVEPAYFEESISNGGVFIAYLGHSATQQWDNGITHPDQLRNDVGRYSVVSDFGCSTAKYAEPDVVSFSELFTVGPESNAVAYVGNSSLGQIGIATSLSRYFYAAILPQGNHTLGLAHNRSKQMMFAFHNGTDMFRIAARTNMLVGDPIMEVAVPSKPNYLLRENEIIPLEERVTDIADSTRFMMIIRNHGGVIESDLEYSIHHTNNDTLVNDRVFTIPSPLYKDTVFFALAVKDLKGIHRFTVTLDPNGFIDELIETDNEASGQFTVAASSATVLNGISSAAVYYNEIAVLNPVFPPPNNTTTLLTEIGITPTFDAGTTVSRPVEFGEVVTQIPISDFTVNQRYYFRYRLDPTEEWTGPFTFFRLQEDAKQAFIDSVSFEGGSREFYLQNGEIVNKLVPLNVSLLSGGLAAGNHAIVAFDGLNTVSDEIPKGYYLAVLDGITHELKSELKNITPLDAFGHTDTLTNFLGRIVDGDILLATIAKNATNRDVPWTLLTDAFHQFGSSMIDQLRADDAWCMIGVKGTAPGTANERYVPREEGKTASIDTTFYTTTLTAGFRTQAMGPAGKWKELRKSLTGGSVAASVAGITPNLSVDTLQSLVTDPVQDLSSIDAETYPQIALGTQIRTAALGIAPRDMKITLEYDLPAELAVNYQTVSMPNTEVPKGTPAEATARIYNVGELPAANVKAELFFLTPANDKVLLKEITIPELAPGASHEETVSMPTADYTGQAAFIVEVDNGGAVRELTRSNNTYTVPFTILGDTSKPTLDVTIDGIVPYDGDYVRSRPDVVVKLFDNSPLPIEDASSFLVYLNDTLVVDDPGYDVTFTPGTGEEKGTLTLRPVLEDGTHFFRFNAVDESGNKAFAEDMEIMVIVESDAQLLDLYNVPNPFSGPTNFTFTLTGTQVPQEMEIKVFTVAGRLIRDIIVPPAQLRIGYNNIRWDGLDEDGDQLANGTYLYKLSYTLDDGRKSVIGKIAVLR